MVIIIVPNSNNDDVHPENLISVFKDLYCMVQTFHVMKQFATRMPMPTRPALRVHWVGLPRLGSLRQSLIGGTSGADLNRQW